MIDKTGQPRTSEEILDAFQVISEILVKQPTVLPKLTVNADTIRDCLRECLARRSELEKD